MAGPLDIKVWTVLLAAATVISSVLAVPPQRRTARLRNGVDKEDPVYLYQCMLESVAEYELVAKVAETRAATLTRASNDHVCYGDLGCFFLNGTYGNFWMLPYSPEYIKTRFFLYTTAQQTDPELLDYRNSTTLANSKFRGDLPTTILIHGFGNDPQSHWIEPFRQTIFRNVPEGNYIMVDWEIGAKPPNYWAASANTQVVGAQVARLIAALNTHMNSTSSQFHVIGYSLGAHASGYTGARLQQYGHERAGRITALDPAGPIFEGGHADALVSTGDADFVTGFHANGALLVNGGFGLHQRVGDIDFYPNGGRYQPGCPHAIWGAISSIVGFDFGNLPDSVKCNHHRALELAMEALEPDCLHHSYACDDWESFKEGSCDPDPDGQMSLFANALKVTVQLSQGSEKSSGDISVNFIGKNGVVESLEKVSEEESFSSGKTVVEVLPSRFEADEIGQIKIAYTPECGWGWTWSFWSSCSPDRILIENIVVENLSNKTNKVCGGYQTLHKDHPVTVTLTSC